MRDPDDVLWEHWLSLIVSALLALGMLAWCGILAYGFWRLGLWVSK
jgi:hypothetical protein